MGVLHIRANSPDEALYAFVEAVDYDLDGAIERDSRAGPTIEFDGICVTQYDKPHHRVIFCEYRNANPFFALFESLWMLGGKDDLASLIYFNSTFGQYSDDGKFVRGSAYGKRWRDWFGHDQLEGVISKLRANPNDRRCVLTQWDAATDPIVESKDVPCNTQSYLLVREGLLDLTVVNRSNDAIYGAYGSNVVHFSFLLEYIARMAGLPMGRYYQVSNCAHVYVENDVYRMVKAASDEYGPAEDRYTDDDLIVVPLIPQGEDTALFHRDLKVLLAEPGPFFDRKYLSSFFEKVVHPMVTAWSLWKEEKDPAKAAAFLEACIGQYGKIDWLQAGYDWMERKWLKQQEKRES